MVTIWGDGKVTRGTFTMRQPLAGLVSVLAIGIAHPFLPHSCEGGVGILYTNDIWGYVGCGTTARSELHRNSQPWSPPRVVVASDINLWRRGQPYSKVLVIIAYMYTAWPLVESCAMVLNGWRWGRDTKNSYIRLDCRSLTTTRCLSSAAKCP